MCKNGFRLKIVAVAFILLSLAGCATQQFTQGKDKFSHFKEIAIVVDATVTHGRAMKDPLLSIPENEAIAAHLGAITADALRAKGYFPLAPVRAVGMASPAHLEAAFGDSAEPASAKPSSPPFLLAPASDVITVDRIRDLFIKIKATGGVSVSGGILMGRIVQKEEWLPKEANPFGDKPVLLINAQGHFISGGDVVANVGKGAVNAALAIGMVVGGKGSDKIMEMDKDYLALNFRLFDPVTGVLIWQDQVNESGSADEANFAREISKMLGKLPAAVN